MGAKRFTDTAKWRNEWFRTLPIKAKLAWIYLCDECESHGVIKMDYGLATFQLGFKVSAATLSKWYGDKIHFITDEKILVVQFYEFQYGESKDSWSAKVRAREKLEALGFCFKNNTLIKPSLSIPPTVVPQSLDNVPTCLIRDRGIVSINIKKENENLKTKQIEVMASGYVNPNNNPSLKTELSYRGKDLDEIKSALDQIFKREIPKRDQMALSILVACKGDSDKAKNELQSIYEIPEVRGKGIDESKRFVYTKKVLTERFGI